MMQTAAATADDLSLELELQLSAGQALSQIADGRASLASGSGTDQAFGHFHYVILVLVQ
jgi:hypothetical protein